jgi:hypothetical protein
MGYFSKESHTDQESVEEWIQNQNSNSITPNTVTNRSTYDLEGPLQKHLKLTLQRGSSKKRFFIVMLPLKLKKWERYTTHHQIAFFISARTLDNSKI